MQVMVERPFSDEVFGEAQHHVREIRKAFDVPGNPYHPEQNGLVFNRWHWHNLPRLVELHHSLALLTKANHHFGAVKPTYAFLSMYGRDGVCPPHKDFEGCQFTVGLVIDQDASWPLYIDDKAIALDVGDAVFYSGHSQEHYRKPMPEDSKATHCTLAFFHFVPANWTGRTQ